MFGKLLECLKIKGGHLHFRNHCYWDWSASCSLEDYINNPDQFKKDTPVSQSLNLLKDGYAYAHLFYSPEVSQLLNETGVCPHFFLTRDLRVSLISMYRFQFSRGSRVEPSENRSKSFLDWMKSGGCQNFLKNPLNQIAWLNTPGVSNIKYEELVGERGSEVQVNALEIVSRCLQLDRHRVLDEFRNNVIGVKTRTLNSVPSRIGNYWSSDSESIFSNLGGVEINNSLGYEG